MNLIKKTLLFTVTTLAGMAFASGSAWAKTGKMQLVSVKTTAPIVLDATAEAAWNKATAVEVELTETPYKPNNGYEGMKQTTVRIKSLYDKDNVYFFIQYDDPTESLARFPWIKQADGSWKQLVNKDSTGHDNTYYEDKMAMFWEIKARGFAKKGCDVACHMAENGINNGIKDKSPGRKYTGKAGETIDMWHWKGVRTNPLGQFDDQFVNDNNDPNKNAEWGRAGDVKTGGGYQNNINAAKTGPIYMNSPYSDEHKYYVLPSLKADFVDTFKTGDVVPGITLDPFTGPRADIKVKGVWRDGHWTLEVQRSLVTKGEKADIQDVQFKDLKKKHYFGVSVFDNSQINHLYHNGTVEFSFK
jgi:hypothetical protein